MALDLSNPKFTLNTSANYQNTLTDGGVSNVKQPSLAYKPSLTSGIGANQGNRGWESKNRTLSSAATETLDLYDMAGVDIGAGAGLDGLGQAILFEEIAFIVIVNENAIDAAGQLEIEPDASNGWAPIGTHTAATGGALRGQGILAKGQPAEQGFEITDASSHRIKFTANGGDVTYSLYLIARNDDEESSSSLSSSQSTSTSSSSQSSSSQSSDSSLVSSESTSSVSSHSSSSFSSNS